MGNSYTSWTISDELWEAVRDEIPPRERDPKKAYKNKPGQGRPPLPARKALEGIFYVLRTGFQWKAVAKEYGSGSAVHLPSRKGLFCAKASHGCPLQPHRRHPQGSSAAGGGAGQAHRRAGPHSPRTDGPDLRPAGRGPLCRAGLRRPVVRPHDAAAQKPYR